MPCAAWVSEPRWRECDLWTAETIQVRVKTHKEENARIVIFIDSAAARTCTGRVTPPQYSTVGTVIARDKRPSNSAFSDQGGQRANSVPTTGPSHIGSFASTGDVYFLVYPGQRIAHALLLKLHKCANLGVAPTAGGTAQHLPVRARAETGIAVSYNRVHARQHAPTPAPDHGCSWCRSASNAAVPRSQRSSWYSGHRLNVRTINRLSGCRGPSSRSSANPRGTSMMTWQVASGS